MNGASKTTATSTIIANTTVTEAFNNYKASGDTSDPTNPTDPSDPNSPNTPDEPKDDTPQTGDSSSLLLWAVLLGLSGLGMTAVLVLGKKRKIQTEALEIGDKFYLTIKVHV